MKLPIALQLYSVRDVLEQDFLGTLKKVKEMGYDGVELSGLNGRDPLEVKRMLEEVGLPCPSSHVPLDEQQQEGAFARYAQVGCRYVAIPWMDVGENHEKLQANLALFRKLGEKAAQAGITLLYHNHDFEFDKVDGKAIFDAIYDTVPSSLLQTQMDTCWIKFAGQDPAAYLRKYAGRAPLVHLKDFWASGAHTAVPYDLIGKEARAERRKDFEFRPIGYGVQNIPELIRASEDAGAQWLIVEQDQSMDRPTLEAAKMSIDYLHTL